MKRDQAWTRFIFNSMNVVLLHITYIIPNREMLNLITIPSKKWSLRTSLRGTMSQFTTDRRWSIGCSWFCKLSINLQIEPILWQWIFSINSFWQRNNKTLNWTNQIYICMVWQQYLLHQSWKTMNPSRYLTSLMMLGIRNLPKIRL